MLADPTRVYGCILQSPNNRYLLVQGRSTGKWSFPKGHPDEHETPIECARRELHEETGLVAPFMYTKTHFLATGTYFLYKTRTEDVCITNDIQEIQDITWVTECEMKKMSVNVDVSTFLRRTRRPSWKIM